MRSLPIPTDRAGQQYAAGAVFRICVDAVEKPQTLIDRLNGIVPEVEGAEDQYDQLARTAGLHTFPRDNQVVGANGAVTAEELKRLYTYRMLDTGQPGRQIYNRLLISSGDKCPLCSVNTVSTLDHHLPKAHYPILSVAPTNLIPACRDCQSAKMEDYPKAESEQTLHPYYDNIDGGIWLTATVNQGAPASFTFGVTPLAAWSATLADRVRHHMDSFNLPRLFAVNAGSELTGFRRGLTDLYNSAGTNAVRDHLHWKADSWRALGLNTWQLAMYQAAHTDNWFCNGGFALV
jgi:hypothetical protein